MKVSFGEMLGLVLSRHGCNIGTEVASMLARKELAETTAHLQSTCRKVVSKLGEANGDFRSTNGG